MDRATFADRFHRAATSARDFARTLVLEPLPDPIRVRLHLNQSYDGNPLVRDERTYPNDAAPACPIALEDAVTLLYRDGAVPEWIDLAVCDEDKGATIVAATCCGRFTATEGLLYHAHEGYPPFHVVGPPIPPDSFGYEPGSRYSLFWSFDLEDPGRLARLARWSDRVQCLSLHGENFDDTVFGALPPLTALRTLHLEGTSARGTGLAAFPAARALSHLTIRAAPGVSLDLSSMAALPTLCSLT